MSKTKTWPPVTDTEHHVMNRVQAAFTELGFALRAASEHDIEVTYREIENQTSDQPFPTPLFEVGFKRHLRPQR